MADDGTHYKVVENKDEVEDLVVDLVDFGGDED